MLDRWLVHVVNKRGPIRSEAKRKARCEKKLIMVSKARCLIAQEDLERRKISGLREKKSLVNVLSFLVKFTMWEKGQIKRVVREIGED